MSMLENMQNVSINRRSLVAGAAGLGLAGVLGGYAKTLLRTVAVLGFFMFLIISITTDGENLLAHVVGDEARALADVLAYDAEEAPAHVAL